MEKTTGQFAAIQRGQLRCRGRLVQLQPNARVLPVKLTQEFRAFDYLSPWEGTEYVLPGDEKAKQ